MPKITNDDLLFNTYDERTLADNISHLNLRAILCTQKLSAHFCKKYILLEYDETDSGEYFTIANVLKRQPHLSPSEFKP